MENYNYNNKILSFYKIKLLLKRNNYNKQLTPHKQQTRILINKL